MRKNSWSQGKYQVINTEKYLGTCDFDTKKISKNNPIYRSSYEHRMMRICDLSENVVRWGSELIIVPYYYPRDKKYHKYFTDIYVEVIDKDTKKVVKYVLEIKPKEQTIKPKMPKRKTAKSWRNFQNSMLIFEKNNYKWDAAESFCRSRGFIFKKITEDDIFTL